MLVVDGFGDPAHGAVLPVEPCGIDADGAEGVAKDAAEQVTLVFLAPDGITQEPLSPPCPDPDP
jgi:hypothetical protein